MSWRWDLFRRRVRATLSWLLEETKKDPIKSITLAVSGIAIVLSIASYVVSSRSVSIAEQALYHAQQQYREERELILTSKLGPTLQGLSLQPVDNNFKFLDGLMRFPKQIYEHPAPISQDGLVWFMGAVAAKIDQYFRSNIDPPVDELVIVQSAIPVMVQSNYVVKGRRYVDLSLYEIRYQATIVKEKQTPIEPTFTGFSFVRRVEQGQSISNDFLDVAFERGTQHLRLGKSR